MGRWEFLHYSLRHYELLLYESLGELCTKFFCLGVSSAKAGVIEDARVHTGTHIQMFLQDLHDRFLLLLLQVSSRVLLEEKGHGDVLTYRDLGKYAYGNVGRSVVDALILISQSGCCVVYLIFIGQNLSSIFTSNAYRQALFIFVMLPLQILLSFVRSLSGLAPFSIVADICNLLAFGIIVKDDFSSLQRAQGVIAFQSWSRVPFALGVAVFAYEGFGMTLALEASMKRPYLFSRVLAYAFVLITVAYVAFGLIGYLAFSDQTRDIITLNLPHDWSTVVVKMGLCIALAFTLPVMMYPVHEILVSKLVTSTFYKRKVEAHPIYGRFLIDITRIVMLLLVGVIAIMIPTFGVFISFIGNTVCAILGFVLPAFFHLRVFKGSISTCRWAVDFILIGVGIAFATYGVGMVCWDSVNKV
ncbi:hypothetical protein KP509_11G028900 [Ceratopteris richardii]|uniref:Amino acid transporter transmembrane domain-containing protein n=1 Tax=Ceratopteris richardii TaxID=49495 RepID=A0A8T2TN25_CERRI|nr:hypothetical protein KP509_11G028900 [Ceratopteris richardii]